MRIGPCGGRSVIPVFDSFFRVQRDWLDAACKESDGDNGVIWVGLGQNVGLKLRVGERQVIRTSRDEEPAVQYRVEYQSLVIRAAYLLENFEKRRHSYIQTISLTQPHQPVPLSALDPAVLVY
ncbi:hypothetical protein ABW21_db0201362 [Orbilia brochopaga]|nr:hypothetical protein ABW21_db0201362 [Drechslerella brochopaga]